MFKRILVTTDGSPLSKKAVDGAIALAAQHDAELVAVTVVPQYPTDYFEGAMVFSHEDVARVERQWADNNGKQHQKGDLLNCPKRRDVISVEQVLRGKSPGNPG